MRQRPASSKPSPTRTRAVLVEALFTPSRTSVAVMLATSLALAALAGWIASPRQLSGSGRALLYNHRGDDDLDATATLIALQRSPDPGPRVFWMGSSPTRDSVHRDVLMQFFTRDGERFVEGINLCVGRARVLTMLRMVSLLPSEARGLLVIGIDPWRLVLDPRRHFEDDAEAPRLGVRSDLWDAMAAEAGIPTDPATGIYLWDNRRFLLPRLQSLSQRILKGQEARLAHNEHPFWERPAMKKDRRLHNLRRRLRKVDELGAELTRRFQEENLDTLRATIEMARDRGLEVVLVLEPINPKDDTIELEGVPRSLEAWRAPVREELRSFARGMRVPLLEPQRESALSADDFWDDAHLNNGLAAERFTTAMVAQLEQSRVAAP
jgi:hypothetical protein